MVADPSADRRRPAVTVAVVAERAGRFLFVEERVKGALVINQPAGHLDPGESLVDAAVRETLEETAWHVAPRALVAVHQWCSPDDGAEFVRFTFDVEPLTLDPHRALDSGIVRALWLDRDELLAQSQRLRSPLVLRSLDDWLAGRRLPLDAIVRIAPAAVTD
jgi:8-oxo-dGTP pyrophosphatase MutT (NUDIX family)